MSRLMSVTLTEDAVRDQTKTVTRRLGWWADRNGRRLLLPGDRLTLCRKVMGRRRSDGTVEPLERLADVLIIDMSRQQLCIRNTPDEAAREGFPDWSWDEFVEFFCREMKCRRDTPVTRIEWRYLDEPNMPIVAPARQQTLEAFA